MSVIRGTTALVTGGAQGIGLLTGQRLLEVGASRLLIWDSHDAAMRAAAAHPQRAAARTDLMPARVFDRVVGEWFGVDDTMTTFRGRR